MGRLGEGFWYCSGVGLQISQSPRGICINQSKYALESLKKYGFESCDTVDTPMVEKSKLDEDKEEKAVDLLHYHAMIGTLLYLTATFADADHSGCQDTRRSKSGSVKFLGERLISWSSKRQKSAAISSMEAEYIALSGCCAQILWMRSQLSDYGTLLYLTASRPDLQFAICMCARYQARPTEKHVHAVKRIFRYLRGTVNRGLWYPKDSSVALTAFADADHAGCQDTRRSTSGSVQFLGEDL
nr:hypothetical protein [Tanacetum cinerariifolium]